MEKCFGQEQLNWEVCQADETTEIIINGQRNCGSCIAYDRQESSVLIADQQDAIEQYRSIATIDALTGLANRYGLEEAIEQLAEERAVFGALFLDIQNFRAVNNQISHRMGDMLLAAVGKFLSDETREDDIVGTSVAPRLTAARQGGDEFIVLMRLDEAEVDITDDQRGIIDLTQDERLERGVGRIVRGMETLPEVEAVNRLIHGERVGVHYGYELLQAKPGMTSDYIFSRVDPAKKQPETHSIIRPDDFLHRLGRAASVLITGRDKSSE